MATHNDPNIVAAGLLHDLAILQSSERSSFGYKRAGKALAAGTDRSVVDLIEEGTLRDIPYVGASSERVVAELVKTGKSASVEAAVNGSSKRSEVDAWLEERRGRRSPGIPTQRHRGSQRRTEKTDLSPRARTSRGRQTGKTIKTGK